MNSFQFNRLNSPLINNWSDDLFDDNFGCHTKLPSSFTQLASVEQENNGFDLFDFDGSKNIDIFAPMRSRTESENYTTPMEVGVALFDSEPVLAMPEPQLVKSEPKTEVIRKTIKKAKSVKGKKSSSMKKKVSKGKKKRISLKISSKNIKLDTIDSCSTVSNTTRSLNSINEELSCMSPIIGNDVTSTFKLNTRGVVSNIPQIFNSALFSNSSKRVVEDSTCFMHSSLVKKEKSDSSQQLGSVHSFLTSLKSKKKTNFEAGSYMASLETTIDSINQMKTCL